MIRVPSVQQAPKGKQGINVTAKKTYIHENLRFYQANKQNTRKSTPLVKESLIVSGLSYCKSYEMRLPGTFEESNSAAHLPKTPRYFNSNPFTPPSSNCADV